MDKRKFLQSILQGIGVIFTAISSFLGMLYWLKGDILVSGLISALLVTLIFFIVWLLISNKLEITKNKYTWRSIALWIAYLIVSLPASALLVHCLNVEFNAKQNIRELAFQKRTALVKMIQAYENTYTGYVDSISSKLRENIQLYLPAVQNRKLEVASDLRRRLIAQPFRLTEQQLSRLSAQNAPRLVSDFEDAKDEFFKQPVDQVKDQTDKFNKWCGMAFDSWTRLRLNYAFYRLDAQLSENLKAFQEQFSKGSNRKKSFVFSYPKLEGLMDKPLELWSEKPSWLLIGFALLMNFLLLIPYLMEPGSGKFSKGGRSKSRDM